MTLLCTNFQMSCKMWLNPLTVIKWSLSLLHSLITTTFTNVASRWTFLLRPATLPNFPFELNEILESFPGAPPYFFHPLLPLLSQTHTHDFTPSPLLLFCLLLPSPSYLSMIAHSHSSRLCRWTLHASLSLRHTLFLSLPPSLTTLFSLSLSLSCCHIPAV